MKDVLKVGLVFLGLLFGGAALIFLSMKNFLFIIPCLGCFIGLWYLLKLFVFIFQNLDELRKNINFILNIGHSILKSGINFNDPRFKEFVERYSVDPKEFEGNL